MNSTIPNIFKRNSNFLSSIAKQDSNEEKKKRSLFYDDYLERSNQNNQETGFSIKRPVLKLPDLTPQEALAVSQNPETTGSAIKKNIKNVLSQKYGEFDTRSLFDGIDDKDIEDNIETAENTIKTNIDMGVLSKTTLLKLPNLRDGLALSYAAANKGNSKAATKAREAAYTESSEVLVKETGTNLLSTQPTKIENAVRGTDKKLNLERMLMTNTQSNVDQKTDKSPSLEQAYSLPETSVTSIPYSKANDYPKTFFSRELLGQNKSNNHQFSNISDEQKRIHEIAKKEGITAAHAQIKTYAEQWKDVPEYKWTLGDIAKWKTIGGDDYIHQEKLGFIKNYKDVILDAAKKYDIPPILLAGVAYIEYGGAPMWIDDVAHSVRSFDWIGPEWVDKYLTITKNPDLTSFGNTSIQVRRALEMLGYDASTSKRNAVIDSLKDPIQNIYLAASHLNVLRNIDYKGKTKNDLTDNEIKIIASRYNLGPDIALNAIVTEYGDKIYNNKDEILKALS